MTLKTPNWNEASAAIKAAGSILLVTHISPDGDAIGSLMGLTNALRLLGKKVDAAVDGGVPDYLQFLPDSQTVLAALDQGEWDLMVSLDSSDEERTGLVGIYGRAHSKTVINLDHHATNTFFGDIYLVEPQAVSATEIVFHWLNHMNFAFAPSVAVPLLAGLVTDTLGFRTSNVSAGTLEIAQKLMQAGASLTEITARTLDNNSYKNLTIWKHALATVDLSESVISAVITKEDFRRAGYDEVTDVGLVGFLIKVSEAMIAVVFKETSENKVQLSFRSKPGFDVSSVAFSLGGGGHKQASGATIEGPMEAAMQRVLPLLKEAVKQGTLQIV